jgi:hypothetical protein
VDVCAWRPAGVKTKLLERVDPTAKKGFMVADPDTFVAQAFTKCTSGVHHGWTNHEIVGLIIDQI